MLILVATPIGNLGDLSDRAKETLESADYWLVEDSRVSGKLQSALGLNIPMRVLNDHTSRSKIEDYLDLIESDARVVLLTDAGTPVVSDPGAEIVALC
ncbi:MAG: 16S rRNA (cytidine(1402)-2'-O)-methyltransferase, partial [Chthonomonadaceae bacterium]|nr:16S rRNA (cytidine(1402)-2'-O)-methyltransferase [Chthonomonadaceae bacterium]